jgi:beta-N-acetylglucosaminidase
MGISTKLLRTNCKYTDYQEKSFKKLMQYSGASIRHLECVITGSGITGNFSKKYRDVKPQRSLSILYVL